MTTYLIGGGKGGAGRTVTSLLLALGLGWRGRDPVWLQHLEWEIFELYRRGLPLPVRVDTCGSEPYDEWLSATLAKLDADGSDGVVDLPRDVELDAGLLARADILLIPIRPGLIDREAAHLTWRDYAKWLGQAREASRCRLCMLPVAWPDELDAVAEVRRCMREAHARWEARDPLPDPAPEPAVVPWALPRIPQPLLDGLYRASGPNHPYLRCVSEGLAEAVGALADGRVDEVRCAEEQSLPDCDQAEEDPVGSRPLVVDGTVSGHSGCPDGTPVRITLQILGPLPDGAPPQSGSSGGAKGRSAGE